VEEASADKPSAVKCKHPEAVGTRWGDKISKEQLDEMMRTKKPFDVRNVPITERMSHKLTGAEVFRLAQIKRANNPFALSDLHLEGANLVQTHLEGANLVDAHQETLYVNAP
jgi:hypothetical protein